MKIGNPDRNAPVLLTCNFHLTVEMVKKAVKGLNVYLLIANSKGINVWCSAAGGHFTSHNVISVLKTSGIEKLVDHRTVILPQLAATGIEAQVINMKTGWNVLWGPVYAKDIPLFIKNKFEKSPVMRVVRFPLVQRMEMTAMWAFPFSVIASILIFPFNPGILILVNIMIWGWSFLIFFTFPLYSKWLAVKKKTHGFSKYSVIFDFNPISIILWVIFLGFLVIWSLSFNNFNITFILGWGFFSLAIILLINIDLMGSTPIYKSGLHEDRFLKVVLDEDKCKGIGACEQVCPKNCFDLNEITGKASIPRAGECVQCGACIVQCPYDALFFKDPLGKILKPESVRKYKLNLIGKRLKYVDS